MSPTGSDSNSGAATQPWRTFAYATNNIAAGDTLILREGEYAQRLLLDDLHGTQEFPIVIRSADNVTATLDGSSLTVPSGGRAGLVVINNCDHITLKGIVIQNFNTKDKNKTPIGIQVEGGGNGIKLLNNTVHHIWQSSNNKNANGFGIAIYGTDNSPIDGLVLEGNEVHNLRTGQSESIVLNGNVINFLVADNHVHNCNNIGIDFIGYEGTAPEGSDRARDGVCRDNRVHDIDSSHNPGYNGDFSNGGGDRSAAGIYVDGGARIIVERNHVYQCNFGIELASEHAGKSTEEIELRNNLIHHNTGAGIIMGGYDSNRGITRLCAIRNNTLYRNNTLQSYNGQIALQFYLEDNSFTNNIIWVEPNTKQAIVHYVEGGTAAQRAFSGSNRFDYNLYYNQGDAEIEFALNPTGSGENSGNKSYTGLDAWRTLVGGAENSTLHDPGFINPAPASNDDSTAYKLGPTAFARDRGDPGQLLGNDPIETDFYKSQRIVNQRIDVGMHEYINNLQAWRERYFGSSDQTPGSRNSDDPDSDGLVNLIEYSQGLDPTTPDVADGPRITLIDSTLRFQYRKDATDVVYKIFSSQSLDDWTLVEQVEGYDGNRSYWHEFPLSTAPLYLRLEVSAAESN